MQNYALRCMEKVTEVIISSIRSLWHFTGTVVQQGSKNTSNKGGRKNIFYLDYLQLLIAIINPVEACPRS